MINAFYEPFPLKVSGYRIVTDFKDWIRFSDMMNDKDLSNDEKTSLLLNWFIDTPERLTDELIFALCDFYKVKALEPEPPEDDEIEQEETVSSPPVLNWKIDAPCIIADFQRFYSINLLTAKMHWWRFKILFSALPDNSQIMRRIGYRSVDIGQIKNADERKRILELKQLYALPYELDDRDIGAMFMS